MVTLGICLGVFILITAILGLLRPYIDWYEINVDKWRIVIWYDGWKDRNFITFDL